MGRSANPVNDPIPACPANITTWSENLTPGYTTIKAVHVNELRAAINKESLRRRLTAYNFGADVVKDVDIVRKSHADALRAAIVRAIDAPMCITDSTVSFPPEAWIDATIQAGVTTIKDTHREQERLKVNQMETVCVCNCNYCACNCDCTCCDYGNCKHCTHGW